MTQEDKLLLLKDLCGRLPYGVICHANEINIDGELIFVNKLYNIAALYYDNAIGKFESCPIDDIKPYLRSISSMTEDEKEELYHHYCNEIADNLNTPNLTWEFRCCISNSFGTDWLNAHHFDYRELIEKSLAIEASEEMYSIKKK